MKNLNDGSKAALGYYAFPISGQQGTRLSLEPRPRLQRVKSNGVDDLGAPRSTIPVLLGDAQIDEGR